MNGLELTVDATRAAVPTLLAWLKQSCQSLGVSAEQGQRAAILAEELFLNVLDHGYAGQPGAPLHYRLAGLGGDCLELIQEDQARPFDLSRVAAPTANLERVGGLGITLIQGMSQSLSYRRDGDRNITTIRI